MPSSSPDDIAAVVKRSIDIVDLVGEQVPLTRRGRTFKGLCPFHDDHNPSLDVDPERQRYRCWSCGQTGDVFDFVMSRDRVGFRDALELLAQRAGIGLPLRHSGGAESSRNRLFEVLRWAEEQFHFCLMQSDAGRAARAYVAQRGLEQKSVVNFRLGFVPSDWEWLLRRARTRGYDPELLGRCGLAKRRSGGPGWYDLFRGRLMFPIHDARGRTIAFGGRTLPGLESGDQPKYVNSPETAVFNKGEQLYGLDRAKDQIVRRKCAVVVEGYTDCLMAHQHGISHAVGTLGTALGGRHVRDLKRFAGRIVLVFDGDEAGQKSADRALSLFLSQELDLRVFALPENLDPCDFLIRHGAEPLLRGLEAAPDALEYKLQRAGRLFDCESLAGRRQALDFVLQTAAAVPALTTGHTTMTREIMLDRLSQRFGVPAEVIRRRLRELSEQPGAANRSGESGSGSAAAESRRSERELLEIVLADPSRMESVAGQVDPEEITSPALRRIFEVCLEMHRDNQAITLDGLRLRLDDPDLACQASVLAQTGQEKGELDRRLSEYRAFLEHRKMATEAAEIHKRWNDAKGSEEAQRELVERTAQMRRRSNRPMTRHFLSPPM